MQNGSKIIKAGGMQKVIRGLQAGETFLKNCTILIKMGIWSRMRMLTVGI